MHETTALLARLAAMVEAMPVPEPTDADKTRALLIAARRGIGRPGARVAR